MRMKKWAVGILVAVSAIIMSIAVSACGTTTIEGTWYFSSMTVSAQGMTQTVKAGQNYGGSVIEKEYIVLEIKEDNTFSLSAMGNSTTGTWKQDEQDASKYILTVEGDPATYTLKGSKLTFSINEGGIEISYVLKK